MSNANAKLAAALKPSQIVKMTGAEAGMGNVKSFMESQRANLAAVLPKHVDADRMLKLALGAMRTTPKLLNCNVESLMGGCHLLDAWAGAEHPARPRLPDPVREPPERHHGCADCVWLQGAD